MENKTITIRAKTKIVEPKLYTIVFYIENKRFYFQKMAYSLEQAVEKCTLPSSHNFRTPKIFEVSTFLEMTISEIKSQLKNLS